MISEQQVVVVVVIIFSLYSENSFKQMRLRIVKRFLMYLFNGQTNKEKTASLAELTVNPLFPPLPLFQHGPCWLETPQYCFTALCMCQYICSMWPCFPLCVKPELSMFPFWVSRLQNKLWMVLSSDCVRNPDYCKWAMSFERWHL